MPNEQYVRENFVRAYDACADDIFAYCHKKTGHRDIAKYLTRNVFMEVWDSLVSYSQNARNIQKLLRAKMDEHVKTFLSSRKNEIDFSNNLWNLTLSQ